MVEIKLREYEEKISVEVPYNRQFNKEAKNLGGKWDASEKEWVFDSRNKKEVTQNLYDIFGYSGMNNESKVDIVIDLEAVEKHIDKLNFHESIYTGEDNEFVLAGRTLVWRPSRDEHIIFTDGVVLGNGGFAESYGSRANPRLGYKEGTTLKLLDVPCSAVSWMDRYKIPYVELDKDGSTIESLMKHRERLLKDLELVNRLLGIYDKEDK